MSVLHVTQLNKFIPPFIKLVKENFTHTKQVFLIYGDREKYPYGEGDGERLETKFLGIGRKKYFTINKQMYKNQKIIIHGLYDTKIVKLLFFQPWLLKKCYWVIWGSDLYRFQQESEKKRGKFEKLSRRFVIKNMGHLITYIEGDVKLARDWYGAKGVYHDCLMYTTNTYNKHEIVAKKNSVINIQIGNSADPSNNHFEMLEQLLPFRNQNIMIYAPLSYGIHEYAELVVDRGKKLFGEKFVPLLDFMPFDEYLEFLSKIDIALFNHARQQAMGNIITLLGMGKKIYMRKDVSHWDFLIRIKANIFNIEQFNLNSLSEEQANYNTALISNHFSKEALVQQLNRIL